MARWLDVPLDAHATWGRLAAGFDRCSGRVAFYVGQRVQDPAALERIVTEALERNVDLLLGEHDELEELRRLRATADQLIATSHLRAAARDRR
jgi:hypothetical protein